MGAKVGVDIWTAIAKQKGISRNEAKAAAYGALVGLTTGVSAEDLKKFLRDTGRLTDDTSGEAEHGG